MQANTIALRTVLPTAFRFWPKVRKTKHCWIWIGCVLKGGYGVFEVRGRSLCAHRVSFLLSGKRLSKKLTLDHLCRNRRCVNPDHLEAVSMRVNALRGFGAPAVNARKTHCVRGHELAGTNLYPYEGVRLCKRCQNIRTRAYRRRLSEKRKSN